MITWGCCFPPPFQQIIFCIFLCQPWKCKSLEKASHYSFCKNDAHSSFSPESARALHKSQNRGFTFHQSLYCNTGSGQPECIAHQANWCAPADHPGVHTCWPSRCAHLLTIQVWVFTPVTMIKDDLSNEDNPNWLPLLNWAWWDSLLTIKCGKTWNNTIL